MGDAYKPRKLPVQARSRATFDAILEGAAQVLSERGYARTTTNAIAERAGVSIGSLYEYFPDKDAVFVALKEKLHRVRFDTVVASASFDGTASPQSAIRRLLKARIASALDQHKAVAILQKEVPESVLAPVLQQDFTRFSDLMAGFADQYADKIRIRNLDIAIPLGIEAVDLIVNHMAAYRPADLEKPAFLDELSDMMCRYILKDGDT